MSTADVKVFDLPLLQATAHLDYSGTAIDVWLTGSVSFVVTSIDFESPHLALSAFASSRSVSFDKDGVTGRLRAEIDYRHGVVEVRVDLGVAGVHRGGRVEIPFMRVPPLQYQMLPETASPEQIAAVRAARPNARPVRTPTFTSSAQDPNGYHAVRSAFALAGIVVPSPADQAQHAVYRSKLGFAPSAAAPFNLPKAELYAVGAGVEFGFAIDFTESAGIYWTTDGAVGIYGSPGFGGGVVLSASLGVILSYFWGGIDTFNGICVSVGVSFGEGLIGGVEIFWNEGEEEPVGASILVGCGAGIPVDVAMHHSITWLRSLRKGYNETHSVLAGGASSSV